MMERDVSIILSPWVMVRGMRRRMDRSIPGIDSVREGIVDSEIFWRTWMLPGSFHWKLVLGPGPCSLSR